LAVTRKLTAAQTESVKRLLQLPASTLMAEMRVEVSKQTLQLRESFLLFAATVKDLVAAYGTGLPLARACRETAIWHHQLAFGEQVSAFGRTSFDAGSEDGQFLELMNGNLCRQLDQAVQAADRQFSDDYTARLVRIAEANVYFLLLANGAEERVMVVSSMAAERGLAPGSVLSAAEFAEGLRALPPVVGLNLAGK